MPAPRRLPFATNGQNTPTRHTPPNSSPAVSSAVDPLRTPTAIRAPAITSHACHSMDSLAS